MLASGTKLGPYEIQSSIGAGGMGEVYRARDTRLERDVAVKVLPQSLSSDPSLKQRLEREAKAVSKLSHPNICVLHDIGSQDGIDYLVMELLDGETLEHRVTRGPLPAQEVVRYAAQIADALAKAHKLGITHRDLKPANIMLTKAGAKLMDFGLAKQSGPAPLAQALNDMTMEHSKLTGAGIIVGTFQYMAPEQLEGKEADARTDIFALGEVIYEMATGKAAFAGNSRASLIAAIMGTDPTPMSQVQPLTPPALERTVRKCLAKDPEDRWQSASDLASDLKWMAESGSQAGVPAPVAAKGMRRDLLPWAAAVLAVIGAIAFAAIHFLGGAKPAAVIRASILVEEGTFPILTGDFAGPPMLSPDGKNLAYVAAKEQGAAMLWLRPLSGTHAQVLPGTEGAIFPFWSPDGRNLGFFANGKLKTLSIEGGTPAEVCNAPFARGGTWNAQGTIVFAPDFQSVLQQVPAAGGTPKPATVMDSKHDSHRWPVFLPDGRHFLYLAVTHSNNRDPNDGIYLASLDDKENHLVMQGLTNVAYADGRLLFARDNALMAQPFDAKAGTPQGEAQRVSEDVLIDGTIWRAQFDVSHDLLAYVSGGLTPWQARWYDRSGKQLESIGDQVVNLVAVRLSPDGTRLATEAGETKSDIWVYDRKREVNTRLTFGAGTDASSSPVWSPDGKWIAYSGIRHLKNNILRKPVSGGGAEEVLLEGDTAPRNPMDWSADGKSLLFSVGDLSSSGQLWLLPLSGDRKPVAVTQNSFVVSGGKFSPDGHWLAYNSNESGRQELYLMPLGGGAGKWQVSTSGGVQPIWRRDGKELFFWSPDNGLMAVSVTLKTGEVEIGVPHQLFRFANPVGIVGIISPYDVTPDGQRFVLITTPHERSRPVTLVTNWTAELKK